MSASRFYIFPSTILLSLIIGFSLNGCGSKEEEKKSSGAYHIPEGLDRRSEIRFKQYAVQGRILYQQHCANCHQADGTGLAELIPPLAKSDYLKKNPQLAVCIIRYGQNGPIVVNGTNYNQPMPPNPQLKAIEIAEIATYISNAWGNEGEFVSVQMAQEWLNNCEKEN